MPARKRRRTGHADFAKQVAAVKASDPRVELLATVQDERLKDWLSRLLGVPSNESKIDEAKGET